MRKFNLMIVLLLAASCTKPQEGNEIDVPMGSNYIFFDADVATKAMVTSMRGRTFGVLGFKYDTDWASFRRTEQTAPSDLTNIAVSCAASTGVCSYSVNGNLLQWEDRKKYSFFAWYPMGDGVTLTDKVGNPAITFAMGTSSDPTTCPDLVTAMAEDVSNNGDGTVAFTFKHRLSAISVDARNLNDEAETVKDMTITFTSSIYSGAVFPLDPSYDLTPTGTRNNASYTVVGSSEQITVPTAESVGGSTTTDLSRDNIILLIPRKTDAPMGNLTGRLSFIRVNATNGTERENVDFTISKNLLPGRKYILSISFIKNTVSLSVIESGEWTDRDQNIVFE